MNILAHLFLAGTNELNIVGNFIADHVKGNDLLKFPVDIQAGIRMHRAIDEYTDRHPVVKQSILRLRPVYRKYSGVIVDMYYDHYLATDWNKYTSEGLEAFTRSRYRILNSYTELIPARSQRTLAYMSAQNWLMAYADFEGLQKAFTGMSRRTIFPSGMENAVDDLKKCYECFREEFSLFFPELIEFVKIEFRELLQE